MPALSPSPSLWVCVCAVGKYWLLIGCVHLTVRCINIYLSIKRKIDGANALRLGGVCVCVLWVVMRTEAGGKMRDSCFQMQWIMLMSWCAPFTSGHVMSSLWLHLQDYCSSVVRAHTFFVPLTPNYTIHMQSVRLFHRRYFFSDSIDNAIFWFHRRKMKCDEMQMKSGIRNKNYRLNVYNVGKLIGKCLDSSKLKWSGEVDGWDKNDMNRNFDFGIFFDLLTLH